MINDKLQKRSSNYTIAREILAVQIPAYIKETEIIGFDGIPALQEKVKDIQASHERFAGYRKNGKLIGVISYEKNMHHLTICRLVVHPDGFRRPGYCSRL